MMLFGGDNLDGPGTSKEEISLGNFTCRDIKTYSIPLRNMLKVAWVY